ncbi:MAG: LptF/LptG family permease [Chthonomonas sp.]|nr:LptF/LptG family permease [Chthonomonas sp.]
MKLLDRHIYREMLPPFLIGTVFVVLMFQGNILIALYKNLNLSSVPINGILQFVLLKTPEFLTLTLPIGAGLAASLALSRIVRESELTAIRAAGASVRRVMLPVVVMGVLVSALNWFTSEKVAPVTTARARLVENEMGALALQPTFKSNVVLALDRYVASFGSVQSTSDDRMLLSDVLLIERRGMNENTIILAKDGVYDRGIWTIQDPTVWNVRGGTAVSMQSGRPLIIEEKIAVPDFFLTPQPNEQTADELKRQIDQNRALKRDTSRLEVSYQTKFSLPTSCLVFALSGAAMALIFGKRSAFMGTLMSMVCVWAYFNFYIISTEVLGRNGWVSPSIAAWLPNAIFFALSAWIIMRYE